MKLTLISHHLCPYVQRAAIVLLEKGVEFERRWIDLSAKPDWFATVSPLGKTPVLLADEAPIFESAVICEYLEEMYRPSLHPAQAHARAQHRGWMEFGSSVLNTIWSYYMAPDAQSLEAQRAILQNRFSHLEQTVDANGPYFAGETFSMVDAVFGPVFRYFDTFEAIGEESFFTHTPRIRAWRAALAERPSVRMAAVPDYAERLQAFLLSRGSELSRRMREEVYAG